MIRLLSGEDKQIVLEYIERNEIETSFLYGNVIDYGIDNRKEFRRCADYFGFFSDGRLTGILPFYNLGSCIPHYEQTEALDAFVQLMKERSFEFLLGMERIIRPIYNEISGFKDIVECNESSYFINKSFRPYVIDGLEFFDPRQKSDDKEVIDFIIQMRNRGFHEAVDAEQVTRSLVPANPEEDVVIAVKDGKMVAYAAIQTYTRTLNQIGSVYTAEEERGKGYCKAVVSELCKKILLKNKLPTLFARNNNIPAVKAYTALGFERFDDYLFIKFKMICNSKITNCG